MSSVKQPELDRQAHRLARPAIRFGVIAAALAIPGIVLLVLGSGWVWAVGIALVALSLPPASVALGLVSTATVARWASRGRPFA